MTCFSSSSSNLKSNKSGATSERDQGIESLQIPNEISSIPDEGWIKASEPEDFLGPIIFIVPDAGDEDSSCCLLKVDEESGAFTVESVSLGNDEPSSAANVLVGQNLIPHVFSFKSAFGKYLTSDSLGQVSCNKEAVGPAAEWTLLIKPEGISLQNVYDKFLSFKSGRLRCDSESIGFNEVFTVKCQADRKKGRLMKKFQEESRANFKTAASTQDLAELEETESKKMQSFGWGRRESSKESKDRTDLKRAAESGNLRETLLERRIKSKHDPFC